MGLVIALVVLLVVIIVVKMILDEMELSPKLRKIVMLVGALLVFLILLNMFGFGPGWGYGSYHWRGYP